MGTMIDKTTKWEGSNTQVTKSKTYTFATDDKYVDKNIEFTVTAGDGVVKVESPSIIPNQYLSASTTSNDKQISFTLQGKTTVTKDGWVDTYSVPSIREQTSAYYIEGVSLTNGKDFIINDGINIWTWSIDNDGNVSIV